MPELETVWQAFAELSAGRKDRLTPISTADIAGWLLIYDLTGELKEYVYRMILRIDAVFLEHYVKKSEQERKKNAHA